ncbi:FRS2 [Cordylochernes scorpioides]|uniref:FRS2 n=1 Tax=Cordylochernes scorpioides TaxID=51811 RepID=A0ABY6LGR9_9ARAC|nr:FRS2 [Cordylochernes scorpioides]
MAVVQVWNVDEHGRALKCGKIEIAEMELVLHQKSQPPIRWPLRCLRRYGCDAEVFSFESGRRCSTGAGIFAFRCSRAEELFNALQEQIQRYGGPLNSPPEDLPAPPRSQELDSEGYLQPTNPSNHYMNDSFPANCVDLNTNYARLDDLIKHEQKNGFYVNVGPAASAQGSKPSPLTYIQLDLDSTADSSPPPPVTPKDGYVTIDFDKTAALSQSAQPQPEDSGQRKTRHSSTAIPGLPS